MTYRLFQLSHCCVYPSLMVVWKWSHITGHRGESWGTSINARKDSWICMV